MKLSRKKAASIGSALTLYRDSLAKQRTEVLDAAKLRAILCDTSQDALAAEQELVMAWRFYTQEREKQIVEGAFPVCSSSDATNEQVDQQILAAVRCVESLKIKFDPSHSKGIEYVASKIEQAIAKDFLVQSEYERSGEGRVESAAERGIARYLLYPNISKMLEEHVYYWATYPEKLEKPYDDTELAQIFEFSLDGPTEGLYDLLEGWRWYNGSRRGKFLREEGALFTGRSDEEKKSLADKRRCDLRVNDHVEPRARKYIEAHIRATICEDILLDSMQWERIKLRSEEREKEQKLRDAEQEKERRECRLARIQQNRAEFISTIRNMYGQDVLELISTEDIDHYSMNCSASYDNEELWYSILKKYDFDQNTTSCLYFIRQGPAIKIGITNNLDNRFNQIKTSAALPCKIENVVYTHHGRIL